MLEVEGGTQLWCMRILRHEAGHTLDTAFRLHRRRSWQQMFGKSSEPYPDHYRPKPYSKSFVLHLDSWYAQSHPAEDFAETFAVWLAPGSRWRQRYRGWPAMKKLEYVDGLMRELAEQKPLVTSRQRVAPLSQLKKTLREHYTERQERYLSDTPELFDKDLLKLFAPSTPGSKRETAAAFLRRYRPELRKQVAFWTSEYQYTVDQVLQQVITRCRQLKLRVKGSEARTKQQASMLLTVHTMNYLHHGYHRLAL